MKKWWFPISAYVVSCPTCTKNLEWYLMYILCIKQVNNCIGGFDDSGSDKLALISYVDGLRPLERYYSQFYIQLLYRPHLGTWILSFGLLGSKRKRFWSEIVSVIHRLNRLTVYNTGVLFMIKYDLVIQGKMYNEEDLCQKSAQSCNKYVSKKAIWLSYVTFLRWSLWGETQIR